MASKSLMSSRVPIYGGIFVIVAIATTSQLFSSSDSTLGIISDQIRFLYQPTAVTNQSQVSFTFDYQKSKEFLQSAIFDNLSVKNIIVGFISLIAAYFTYKALFVPYALVRNFGDVGYITDGRNKKDAANEIRRRRRAGDVPPVYPNGWFSILRSWELKEKDVKYISALGLELAVYRGEDGKAYIVDAYCPHLGANLGVGGQVKGNCLECPFHGWTFRGSDGKCVDVPYSKKVPEFAKTKAWTSMEANGEIFIWFHAEGEEPGWFPPVIEGIETGELKYHGYTEHYVNAHIQEIPENGADIAHLYHLHTPFLATGTDLRFTFSWVWDWIQHVWGGGWSPHETDKHVGIMTLNHTITAFGKTLPLTSLLAEAHQIGPGICHLNIHHKTFGYAILVQTVLPVEPMVQKLVHTIYTTRWWIPRPLAKIFLWVERSQTGPGVVYLRINFPIIGEVLMMHCVTPLEPLTLRITHTVFAPWYCPRWAAKIALWGESVQIERDLMIWNHKTYAPKPLLVKEDSLISKHRRWYSQFYSENSPRYSARKETLEW